MPTSASFVPLQTRQTPAFEPPEATRPAITTPLCSVTARICPREMVIRRTVPGTGLGANCDADFPPT